MKGVDKLVLITAGGPDGSDYDQAVWGNARLIKADGTAVWLDEVPFEYGVAGCMYSYIIRCHFESKNNQTKEIFIYLHNN